MELRTKELLQSIVKSPRTHARWLNTLSFLEHVGSRKIIKSQNSEKLSLVVLEHIAEEARHAFFFKKLAYKIDASVCFSYEEKCLLAGGRSESYFQELDRQIDVILATQYSDQPRAYFVYLYVTLLVEERAMRVYQLYDEVLRDNDIPLSLRPVLLEEQKHLEQMLELLRERDRSFSANHRLFQEIENGLYQELMGYLEQSVRETSCEPHPHV